MDFESFQRAALRTTNGSLRPDERLLDAAAGMAEEAGEVLGLVRKRVFQQREASIERFVEELGDVLWCVAVAADTLGISMGQIAEANVRKLEQRYPQGFTAARDR